MNAVQKMVLAVVLFIALLMAIGVTYDSINGIIGNEKAPPIGYHAPTATLALGSLHHEIAGLRSRVAGI